MEEEKYQKELFEFEKPKRFFPKLSAFFPKGDFERNVILTLTLDRAVFIAIGIIMVMVAVYALGVESGKIRTAQSTQPGAPVAVQATKVLPAVQIAPAVSARPGRQVQPARAAVPDLQVAGSQFQSTSTAVRGQTVALNTAAANSIKKNTPVAAISKPYTIVAATFTSKETALQEIAKLKKLGFDAAIIQSGRYFQACAGSYADKAGAQGQKDLKKLKRLYKDAYIRLR